jgi:hypothetical protein
MPTSPEGDGPEIEGADMAVVPELVPPAAVSRSVVTSGDSNDSTPSHGRRDRPIAQVREKLSGGPVIGARVRVYQLQELGLICDTITGTDGMAFLPDVTFRHVVVVTHSGFAANMSVRDEHSSIHLVELLPESSCNVTVTTGDEVCPGVAVEYDAYGEMSRLLYRAVQRTQVTDEAGVARFRGLPAGAYTFSLPEIGAQQGVLAVGDAGVRVVLENVQQQTPHVVQASLQISVGGHSDVVLVQPSLGDIEGLLLANGVPLGGALIVLIEDSATRWHELGVPEGPRAETASDGSFAIDGIVPGVYSALIYYSEYPMRQDHLIAVGPGRNRIVVELSPGSLLGSLKLSAGGAMPSISIKCIAATAYTAPRLILGAKPGQSPIPFTEALIASDGGDDAHYTLEGIQPLVELVLLVEGDFVFMEPRTLEPLQPREERRVNLTLRAAGCVEAIVTDGSGHAVSDAIVSVVAPNGSYVYGTSDLDGRSRFGGLLPGDYNVILNDIDINTSSLVVSDSVTTKVESGAVATVQLKARQ